METLDEQLERAHAQLAEAGQKLAAFAELGADFREELRTRAEEMAAIRDIAREYNLDARDLYASFIQQNQPNNDNPV